MLSQATIQCGDFAAQPVVLLCKLLNLPGRGAELFQNRINLGL